MKKIAFIMVGYPMPPTLGGATQTLISYLIQNNEIDYKYDFEVFSPFENKAKEESSNYQHTKFHYINESTLVFKIKRLFFAIKNHILNIKVGNAYFNLVKKIIKSEDYFDAIIVEGATPNVFAFKDMKCGALIAHLHNDDINVDNKSSIVFSKLYDVIIANSDYTTSRVLAVRPDAKIYTLENAINIEEYTNIQNIENVYSKYGIPNNKSIILYVGRIDKMKGVQETIKAFVSNKYLLENAHLVIAGSVSFGKSNKSGFLDEVKRECNFYKNQITLTGYVPHSDLPKLYSIATIGIVPSIWEETFGLVAVEHMAMGIPVVYTDSGALPNIITNGCGIMVKRNEQIVDSISKAFVTLLNNDVLRKELGDNARNKSNMFSKDQYCKRFDDILNDILK